MDIAGIANLGSSIINAGVGIGTAIDSSIKAKKARQELAENQAKNQAIFDKMMYQGMMDRSENQAALNAWKAQNAEQSRMNKATSSITGGTAEIDIAKAQAANDSLASLLGNMAVNESTRRDALSQQQIAANTQYANAVANSYTNQAAQSAQAASNAAASLASSAGGAIDGIIKNFGGQTIKQ